ncbi:3D domain-containing protein [Algibacter agarivorans]|uniref:3D domain-containing protein n=1 Tax=Algibacter agarivorans TaxID=1109741 RepID=A0ABP9GC15_9FLAO
MIFGCKNDEPAFEDGYIWDSIDVTASAYNSLAYQTDSDPNITAFGDSLKPGFKYIAVSRDLLRLGLKHNIPVKIEGLEGIYFVKDKMHSRWTKRIDIYMGIDVKAAKQWGRKRVCIDYGIPIKE